MHPGQRKDDDENQRPAVSSNKHANEDQSATGGRDLTQHFSHQEENEQTGYGGQNHSFILSIWRRS